VLCIRSTESHKLRVTVALLIQRTEFISVRWYDRLSMEYMRMWFFEMCAEAKTYSSQVNSDKNANALFYIFLLMTHFHLPREYGVYKLTFSISENVQVLCEYSVCMCGSLYVGTM
jgi:hypothetical protein